MSRFVSGKSFAAALVVMCAAVMVIAPAGSAALVAPKAGTPCASQTLDRLTPFTWTGVTGADHYEFYVSADPGFSSDIFNDTSIGHFTTRNTRATVSKTLPNGTYYWRVRAVSATNAGGAWSATCSFTMNWSDQPQPQTPADGGTLTYPHPLLLDWTPANGAKQYRLTVSTSPDLSSPVNGFPVTTTATQFSPPNRLASGDYYWGVTPIDAEGHDGLKSDSFSFTWDWPATDTTLSVTDLDSAPEVFDPQFSWTPIPGASSYQIEINPDGQNWSSGSKICCSDDSVATSYSPTTLLPANTYYWRVRAKDATGNYGPWVVAPNNNVAAVPFTIAYDLPGVLNLNMDDAAGNDVWSPGYTTDTPIVTWNPTPGAASYDVDVVPYESSQCQWGFGAPVAWHSETADAAWTPLGAGFTVSNPFPNTGHPGVSGDNSSLQPGESYCVRVRARRHEDGKNNIVYGAYTQLGGVGNPAFTFSDFPTGGICTAPCNPTLNIGAGDYGLPLATGNTRLPVFTWKPISGKQSYVVIVATDNTFQNVIDEAFTQVPAYAPRTGNQVVNYPDTSGTYAWAVLPATGKDGSGGAGDPTTASSYPQTFDLHSIAPSPITPANNVTVSTQPTFRWSPVTGAYQYKLYVSTDPSFGTLMPGSPFLTAGTSFTASNFPASAHLYWKVQALDRSGNGLAYSATQQFQKTLAVPTFATVTNPTSGDGIPVLQWDPMPGAIGYDVHVNLPSNGSGRPTSPSTRRRSSRSA